MIKTTIKNIMNHYGYKVVATDAHKQKSFRNLAQTQDYMGDEFLDIWREWCRIMNSESFSPSFYTTYKATRYVVLNEIEGEFVESGVYQGTQCMFIALTLQCLGATKRAIYLYDTFEGMPQPGEMDLDLNKGMPAIEIWNKKERDGIADWNYCTIDRVKELVLATGYGESHFVFVKGKVQDTLRQTRPDRIALLRLDTDFYESTKAEMNELFPRLSERGVFIVDGYGRWAGQSRAVDEYFATHGIEPLLLRVGFNDWVSIKI